MILTLGMFIAYKGEPNLSVKIFPTESEERQASPMGTVATEVPSATSSTFSSFPSLPFKSYAFGKSVDSWSKTRN